MNEQCAGCPWMDELKKQCQRTPPRFCFMDEVNGVKAAPEVRPAADAPRGPASKIHRAA